MVIDYDLESANKGGGTLVGGPVAVSLTDINVEAEVEKARRLLVPIYEGLDIMAAEAPGFVVRDDESERAAVSRGGILVKIRKALDVERAKLVKQPNAYVKTINTVVKDLIDRVKGIEAAYKSAIDRFQYAKELERRKKEREAEEARKKMQEALDKEAAAAGVEAPAIILPKNVAPQAGPTRTDSGSTAYQKKTWVFEITDPDQVPRNFCEPSESLIRKSVQMGVRDIPGVRIWEKTETVIRT